MLWSRLDLPTTFTDSASSSSLEGFSLFMKWSSAEAPGGDQTRKVRSQIREKGLNMSEYGLLLPWLLRMLKMRQNWTLSLSTLYCNHCHVISTHHPTPPTKLVLLPQELGIALPTPSDPPPVPSLTTKQSTQSALDLSPCVSKKRVNSQFTAKGLGFGWMEIGWKGLEHKNTKKPIIESVGFDNLQSRCL